MATRRFRPCSPPAALDKVVLCGPLEPSDVLVEIVEGQRSFPEDVLAAAKDHWAELLLKKPACFDGTVWTLAGISRDAERVTLRLQQSTYSLAVFTHFSEQGRKLDVSQRSGVIGVGCLTFTQEGLLVVGRRSEHLAMLGGYWSYVPVGVLDTPDLKHVLAKELEEELGVVADEVEDLWFAGLLDAGTEQGHAFNAVFVQTLRLSVDEVRSRFCDASDHAEHSEIRFVDPSAVHGLNHTTQLTLSAVQLWQHLQSQVVAAAR